MKKKSGSRTGRFIGRRLNVKAWVDLDRIAAGKRYVTDLYSRFISVNKKEAAPSVDKLESFDEAKVRLNLTDKDLLVRQKSLFRLAALMVVCSIGIFLYMIYNLIQAYYLAALLTLIVCMLSLVLAFRYHFWYFQIKQHKLGCTVSQWFKEGLMGVKDE